MNKNSVKAYHAIKPEIPAKEREVLHMIKMYGPINGRMLDVRISGGHKRIKNLMDMGCIGIAYIADDAVTGRESNYYMWLTDKPKAVISPAKKDKAFNAHLLYDEAFKSGVRAGIAWLVRDAKFNIHEIENMVANACEVME